MTDMDWREIRTRCVLTALSRGCTRDQAEDVAQDAMMAAVERDARDLAAFRQHQAPAADPGYFDEDVPF